MSAALSTASLLDPDRGPKDPNLSTLGDGKLQLCTCCKNIDFEEVFLEPENYYYNGYKHHPDLASMIQAASSGCELCSFFLKCAKSTLKDVPERGREGGQLYLRRDAVSIRSSLGHHKEEQLCSFDSLAPHKSSRSCPRKAEPMTDDTSSDACFERIHTWLAECATHEPCRQAYDLRLPTRVLDVGSRDGMKISLKITNGTRGRWVALSHCWGHSTFLQLTTDVLTQMEKEISDDSLPQTFRDAVYITRRLGFRYLWIDSLCIIKDSPADWNHESGQMAYVYRQSALTISAEAARDGSFGIFRSANTHRPEHVLKMNCRLSNYDLNYFYFQSKAPQHDANAFHLHQRAWVLQETILPQRLLSFTSSSLIYTCHLAQYSEQWLLCDVVDHDFRKHNLVAQEAKRILFPDWASKEYPEMALGITSGDYLMMATTAIPEKESKCELSTRQDSRIKFKVYLDTWYSLVQTYVKRHLTFEKDRLPAIAGIAKIVGELLGYSYKSGLWDQDLVRGLAWWLYFQEWPEDAYESDAPSWTWASISFRALRNELASLKFVAGDDFQVAQETKVLNIYLEHTSDDPYLEVSSGFLKMSAQSHPWMPDDNFASIFDCRKDFGNNAQQLGLLLLLLGEQGSQSPQSRLITLILKPSDLPGTFRRVGLCIIPNEGQKKKSLENWPIKTITII